MTLIITQQVDKNFRRRRKISIANRKVRDRRENSTRRDLHRFWTSLETLILKRVKRIGRTGFIIEEIFRPVDFISSFNSVILPQFNRTLFAGIIFEESYINTLDASQSYRNCHLIEQVVGPTSVPGPEDVALPPNFTVNLTTPMKRRISSILQSRSVGVWRTVGPSMRNSLNRILIRSIDEGDSFETITERLKRKLKAIKNTSPAAIARTETTFLMNAGGQIERTEMNIPSKEWVATIDAQNRGANPKSIADHITPDGQVVANGEAFRVSGQFLLHPADTSLGASADNVVNCRCSSISSLQAIDGRRR